MRGLDDCSRYVIGWKLCGNMRAGDVTDTLDIALAASGCDGAKVLRKPPLLSNNGSSYIAGDLAECREDTGMKHVSGAPMHLFPTLRTTISALYAIVRSARLRSNIKLTAPHPPVLSPTWGTLTV